MKIHSIEIKRLLRQIAFSVCLLSLSTTTYAQNAEETPKKKPVLPVEKTFAGSMLNDNQSVMLPRKGAFEFVIQHRFGVVNNGYKDFYGLYAPSNIRLGFNYSLHNNLQIGIGFTKERMQWDGNVKYAIARQAQIDGMGMPFSISYYGLMSIDTREKEGNFYSDGDRLSYFHQILLARKFSKEVSIQIAPSVSWFNNVEGYLSADGTIKSKMNNAHVALSLSGSFAINYSTAIVFNYDQPLTAHETNNPHPNVSLGIQLSTSSHLFQMYLGNYYSIIPQANNMFNQNDMTDGQFLLGFNISKH